MVPVFKLFDNGDSGAIIFGHPDWPVVRPIHRFVVIVCPPPRNTSDGASEKQKRSDRAIQEFA